MDGGRGSAGDDSVSWPTQEQASREPAVAGTFYPAQARQVERALDEWFMRPAAPRQQWRAALVPHAGWVYSGRIAAEVLRQIQFPSTVIVLCPQHGDGGAPCAVAPCAVAPWARWHFPGGSMAADTALSRLLASDVPGLQLDERPHRREHAIEVQLPLLARLAPAAQLVGITVGRISLAECQSIAADLAALLADRSQELLWVISSDMNHFADDAENRRLDALALDALEQLRPELLYAVCHQHRITMCGMLPAVIVLTVLQRLGQLREARRVDYDTSAAVSGDQRRVVGYAGMLFR